jgi:3-oxoacyl-[acyl-carrier protein] reductase
MTSTPGVLEYCRHEEWRQHRFGLPPERWAALAGKVIWITGAGTGFGRAVAIMLAAAGARPVLSGRRRQKLDDTSREMRMLGVDPSAALALPCDITSESEIARAMNDIERQRGSLDGLVACAALPQGPHGPSPLLDGPLDAWNSLLETNITAQWLAARAGIPLMVRSGRVRTVFFTSEAGWAFTAGFGPYNLTKAALNSLGGSLAAEAATRFPSADVQINVLNPGEAQTEMNAGSSVSPYTVVAMTLLLLSHPPGGPNGCFFARDGRHLAFAHAKAWPRAIL